MNRHQRRAQPKLLGLNGKPIVNAAAHSEQRKGVMCHEVVQKIAMEMAGTFYEKGAHYNTFYAAHPSQEKFIKSNWGDFVAAARGALVDMLNLPRSDEEKEQIYEILQLDRTLPRSQTRGLH